MDIITQQIEWIKARNLGGNDQLVKMMKFIESLEAENAQLKAELMQSQERCRVATQMIIDEVGACGPESLESAIGRLVAQNVYRNAKRALEEAVT